MTEWAKIESDEWLTMWQDSSTHDTQIAELLKQNKILEDWCKRNEYRIQKLEEQLNAQ